MIVHGTHDDYCGEAIAGWYGAQVGQPVRMPYVAIARISGEGRFICAVLLDGYNGANIDLHITGRPTRDVVDFVFGYAFRHLKCTRVSARPPRWNARARKDAMRMGFEFEGVEKRFFGTRRADDAIVYRLDPSAAERWMRNESQHASTAAAA